jgi:hypothetical protein
VRNNYQPHAVEPSPVPAHQCRCLQFQDALFDLGDEIDAALKALARAVATKPEWLSPGDFVFDGFAPEDTRKSRLAGVKYETRKALKLATLNSRIRELADRAGVPTELAQPRVLRLASGRAMWKRLIDQDDATPESCDLAVRRFLGAASERDIRRNLGLDEE